MRLRTAWTILVLVVVLIVIALMRFDLTALREPGSLETSVANWGTHFLIRRASRQGIPPRPLDTKASIASGRTLYTSTCGFCHGSDGRAQTPIGQWTYPRAANLTSEQVQSFSDQELFWIIQNGVRFTGMPAFAKVETPDHIWDLVNYVRTLPSASRKEESTNTAQQKEQASEQKQ
jgi:mono/diheme cytochrome c family protein